MPDVGFTDDRRLADGSFNPNPREKRGPERPAREIGREWSKDWIQSLAQVDDDDLWPA